MAIPARFDVHSAQITFDAPNRERGEVLRGRIRAAPEERDSSITTRRHDLTPAPVQISRSDRAARASACGGAMLARRAERPVDSRRGRRGRLLALETAQLLIHV